MASAELAQFPLTAQALVARLPLLTQLADFQRALNEEFDSCRHGARYRPGAGLLRLSSGIELLCQLQQELLHPALAASRPQPWPALDRAMESVVALRDLVALGGRAADTQQRALMALLEGLVQLHFVSLDELLAEVDATSLPWEELERSTEAALLQWRADSGGVENLYAVG
ncbi:hypothetical protein J2X20_001282 [Pelomonas saccharophila]|uniref:Uncharacterized protein n=1 Tax=Roseateles saccharophilus TaxID=304 RepID=A0ABU1YIH2_ROSSA|nr:hypothetical protein [Roseateles saccharophilus]MDR7268653.1 hypothetical protein [Roseateles saccharophilus]